MSENVRTCGTYLPFALTLDPDQAAKQQTGHYAKNRCQRGQFYIVYRLPEMLHLPYYFFNVKWRELRR